MNDHGIMGRFTRNVQARPDVTAIVCGSDSLSYSELATVIRSVVELLELRLPAVNPAVAVCAENGFLYPAIALAGSALGFTVVPIATSLKPEQIDRIFQTGRPDILVSTGRTRELFSNDVLTGSRVACHLSCTSATDLGNWDISDTGATRQGVDRQPSGFVMNFTSGSTGTPKPVCISEQTKLNRILAGTSELFSIDESDVVLVSTPQYHSLGFRQSLVPLVLGGTCVVMPRFSSQGWIRAVAAQNVSFTIGVASQFTAVADALKATGPAELSSLKSMVCSSAPFTPLQRQLCKACMPCRIVECYGASEIGIASVAEVDDSSVKTQSVGFAPGYADIRIVDPVSHAVLPDGETGEMAVKTHLAFTGYYANASETERSLEDGYFLTGDLGYKGHGGEIFFVGRHKEVIQNSGVTVYPSDIEMCCLNLDGITDACALSFNDACGSERIGLCVVADAALTDNEIFRHLLLNLSKWQIPKVMTRLKRIPLTPIGKIDKHAARSFVLEAAANP